MEMDDYFSFFYIFTFVLHSISSNNTESKIILQLQVPVLKEGGLEIARLAQF